MAPILLPISTSASLYSKLLGADLSVPTVFGITITFMLNNFLCIQASLFFYLFYFHFVIPQNSKNLQDDKFFNLAY